MGAIFAGSGLPVGKSVTSSSKYFSKPAGEMISSRLASSSLAFQNVCHSPRGL